MTFDREARARIALAFLVLFSVASAMELAVRSGTRLLRRSGTELDRVTMQERRLQPLRPRLSDHRLIGYVSDDLTGRSFRSLDGMREYFITQYSLAPTIVVVGTDHELVLGNFAQPTPPEGINGLEGFNVALDVGNGVALYSRGPR